MDRDIRKEKLERLKDEILFTKYLLKDRDDNGVDSELLELFDRVVELLEK